DGVRTPSPGVAGAQAPPFGAGESLAGVAADEQVGGAGLLRQPVLAEGLHLGDLAPRQHWHGDEEDDPEQQEDADDPEGSSASAGPPAAAPSSATFPGRFDRWRSGRLGGARGLVGP